MARISQVDVAPARLERLAGVAPAAQLRELQTMIDALCRPLEGRVIWNVSSTAAGGGVAEMLYRLMGYALGAGFDARWLVIEGAPDFYRVTKRLHHALHGERGDGSALDESARRIYEDVLQANAAELTERVARRDVVFLHDPQTAGLIPALRGTGASLVWRCHVGADERNAEDTAAWKWLRVYLDRIQHAVFTREAYVPDYLRGRVTIIPPNIDPLSPKNQSMSRATVGAILEHAGIVASGNGRGRPVFRRSNGASARVESKADLRSTSGPLAPEVPLVLQVSRWDRLKDPVGVLRGFQHFLDNGAARGSHLVLAGPQSGAVSDDPEGAEVFAEVVAAWEDMPADTRSRIHLVALPMKDVEENAAIVNALQRHAAVVVQKSLREGFGLTVTEAMWKSRPVIGSEVGGIQDQIEHEKSGLLVDPRSIEDFSRALAWIFADDARAAALGKAARARVRKDYLGAGSLLRWARLLERLDVAASSP